ncbi:hypothetical protein AK88_02031 [Plasmodium fragile]|uniref:Homologous-pairing protein 2 winged helix domain-containing protein n=1 Tax=Plasmodium fragile TaxID=5857 RepID=A0A0D9QME7_PLAFR|nr:uncharacterized protein AK88_02031 [Plasmodium fragile]KJP88250.1 hypothetical protein AK88_02031 [Plasmodium fragile]
MKNNKSKGGNKKKVERAKGGSIITPGNADSPKSTLQNGGGKDKDKEKGEATGGTYEEGAQEEDQNKHRDGHQTADNNFGAAEKISPSPSSACAPMQVPPSGKKVEYTKKENNKKKAQKGKTSIIQKGAAASGDMNVENEKQSNNNKKRNKPTAAKNSKKVDQNGEQNVNRGEDSKKGLEKKMHEEETKNTKGEIEYEGESLINKQPMIGRDLAKSRGEGETASISPDHQILESVAKNEAGNKGENAYENSDNANGVKINASKKRKVKKQNEPSNDEPEATTLIEKNQKKTATKNEAANKPKGAEVTLSEEETKEKIYKYMKQTNRPYSVINVYDNLHGTISKNVVQKLMDELSTEKKLQCKEYGKAKVYLVNQREFKSLNVNEMRKLKNDIEIMRQQTEVAKNDLNHFVKIKKKFMQDLELVENMHKYKKDFQLVEEEIKVYEEANKTCKLTADEIDLIKKRHGYLHAMWLKRKSLCVEIIKCLATVTDKDAKGVMFHLGIDVDEDVVPLSLYS